MKGIKMLRYLGKLDQHWSLSYATHSLQFNLEAQGRKRRILWHSNFSTEAAKSIFDLIRYSQGKKYFLHFWNIDTFQHLLILENIEIFYWQSLNASSSPLLSLFLLIILRFSFFLVFKRCFRYCLSLCEGAFNFPNPKTNIYPKCRWKLATDICFHCDMR